MVLMMEKSSPRGLLIVIACRNTSSLYINLSLGPSIFTTFGNKDGTFGLGLGGILSLSYAFSDPGFILMGGMEGSCTLLFDDSNPVMLGLFLGVGYKI